MTGFRHAGVSFVDRTTESEDDMHKIKSALLAIGLAVAAQAPALSQPAAAPAVPTVAPVAAAPTPAAPITSATPAVKADAAKPAETTIGTSKPVAGMGQPVDKNYTIQPQVTKLGEQALWMHNAILMPVMVGISVFVLGLMMFVAFRFRRKANPVPSKTTHNTFIEIVWTLIPVLILVVIAVPSIQLLAAQYKPAPADAVTIKAIGNQWFWTHEYPDYGLEVTSNMLSESDAKARGEPRLLAVDNRIVLPVNKPIRLLTTANDVIHAWAMPAFWIKMDAIPGRINETSFTVEKTGVYYGQCSELCGIKHAYMPIAVEVVSEADFKAWVLAKGGKLPEDKAAAATAPAIPAAPAAAPAAAPKG
jgi:cytochrome c oxidase subunit II